MRKIEYLLMAALALSGCKSFAEFMEELTCPRYYKVTAVPLNEKSRMPHRVYTASNGKIYADFGNELKEVRSYWQECPNNWQNKPRK